MMSREEFTFRMRNICEAKSGNCALDPELNHKKADEFMCKVLEDLGYGEGIKIFDKMTKWYS